MTLRLVSKHYIHVQPKILFEWLGWHWSIIHHCIHDAARFFSIFCIFASSSPMQRAPITISSRDRMMSDTQFLNSPSSSLGKSWNSGVCVDFHNEQKLCSFSVFLLLFSICALLSAVKKKKKEPTAIFLNLHVIFKWHGHRVTPVTAKGLNSWINPADTMSLWNAEPTQWPLPRTLGVLSLGLEELCTRKPQSCCCFLKLETPFSFPLSLLLLPRLCEARP